MFVYKPGCLATVQEIPYARYQGLKDRLRELLDGGNPEHVSVLFKDPATGEEKPADMFVDEDGHRKGLPFNKPGTDIYQHYSVSRLGADAKTLPVIAGTAIVFDKRVWD